MPVQVRFPSGDIMQTKENADNGRPRGATFKALQEAPHASEEARAAWFGPRAPSEYETVVSKAGGRFSVAKAEGA